MASGAGVNRVGNIGGVPLLTVPPGASTPVSVAYGSYGTNSGAPFSLSTSGIFNNATIGTDSGVQMLVAAGFTKWTFCLIGPGSTATTTAQFNISIYGTTDPTLLGLSYATGATIAGTAGHDTTFSASLTAIPATSWFLLPAPSEQSGTGVVTNPLTSNASGGTILTCSLPLVAVRAVLTGAAPTTGTAPVTVLGFAVP